MNSAEFEKYQEFTEITIHSLSSQVTELERKLDMFTNALEISIYINQFIKDPNLFSMINDMLIGVFGAKQSSIYIKLDDYYEASSQKIPGAGIPEEKQLILDHREEEFIINSNQSIFTNKRGEGVHSCIGVPMKVDNRLIGFLLIQHQEKDYFTKEHAKFLSLIGNHIGVAIENNFLYRKIMDNANMDGLTELFNKRYFYDTLKQVPNLSKQDYSLVILDLDNFKRINDTYGHLFGDVILKTVSQIIKSATRSNDIVARYGGDEIILFLANFTDQEKVLERVEAIRKEIADTVIEYEGLSLSVTASFGIYIKQEEILTLEEVIRRADRNLYISKNNGKNKVIAGHIIT